MELWNLEGSSGTTQQYRNYVMLSTITILVHTYDGHTTIFLERIDSLLLMYIIHLIAAHRADLDIVHREVRHVVKIVS